MSGSAKHIAILGSTGSIGKQTIDVAKQHKDYIKVVALAVYGNVEQALAQAHDLHVSYIAVGNVALRNSGLEERYQHITFSYGSEAIVELVHIPQVDTIVNALVGAAGMRASYETLLSGKQLALANKESLVVAGDLIMPLTHKTRLEYPLMPIDSEHGAIYQCLLGESLEEVSALWITASGGPFRGRCKKDLEQVTASLALAHPTWQMGPKITIDSSTLMNKGLEVIEAHHLFSMPYDRIKVVVQPQSAIHSMVEYMDGSVKAHLGTTDMRIPIQFALSYPKRWESPVKPLDFTKLGSLQFEPVDEETFHAFSLAKQAGITGGTLPCVMNAANEIAVAAFLQDRCSYLEIPATIEKAMEAHAVEQVESLDQLSEIDSWARAYARDILGL
ncbi:MAG: 1-deoxy-D-xylulose-5-phosphate reductoisomerase [Eggerthellaceae bacterium]|nr:1-deoxy-D-xylulose-5-phosphate reductoisomerase [Eggerthellaceae bacterium]